MTTTIDSPLVLEITRHFDAPPERVFDAWLGKDWGDWIGTPNVRGEIAKLEPYVGGTYHIVMHKPDATTIEVWGSYREITRPSKLVFSWKWEHEGLDTLVTLTFRANGKGTDMTLHHSGFNSSERRDNHNIGWTSTLDKLTAFLERA